MHSNSAAHLPTMFEVDDGAGIPRGTRSTVSATSLTWLLKIAVQAGVMPRENELSLPP
jgi:hypothetical protein